MSKYTGGPAFPHEFRFGDGTANRADGMTLRDYFAVHASEQDIRNQAEVLRLALVKAGLMDVLPDDWRLTARYMHADAMLAERNKA